MRWAAARMLGGYSFYVSSLNGGGTHGQVVSAIVYSGEFITGHRAALDTFLTGQYAPPAASAVWFGSQQGGSDTVQALYNALYRTDFYDFEGTAELSTLSTWGGAGPWYNGSCSVRYTAATQQLTLLDNTGNPIGSGTIGQRVNGNTRRFPAAGVSST